jgi:hypothetical protein
MPARAMSRHLQKELSLTSLRCGQSGGRRFGVVRVAELLVIEDIEPFDPM